MMTGKLLEKSAAIYESPRLLLTLTIIITLFFSSAIPDLPVANDLKSTLPANQQKIYEYNQHREAFGSNTSVIIAFHSRTGVYSKNLLSYLYELTQKIEDLNRTVPVRNISKILDISEKDAQTVIEAIDLSGIFYDLTGANKDKKKTELKNFLTSEKTLTDNLLWDENFASKISKKTLARDPWEIYKALIPPVEKITSLSGTAFITGPSGKKINTRFRKVKNSKGHVLYRPVFRRTHLKKLQSRIESWSLYNGSLVSYYRDETGYRSSHMTRIMIVLDQDCGPLYRDTVINTIIKFLQHDLGKMITAKNQDREYYLIKDQSSQENAAHPELKNISYYVSGAPVISHKITVLTFYEISVLFAAALLVSFLIFLILFRKIEAVFYSLLPAVLSTVWTLGFMSLLGIPVSFLFCALPVILIVYSTCSGRVFIKELTENTSTNRPAVIRESLYNSGITIIIAALCMITVFIPAVCSNLTSIRNFGIFTCVGILFSTAALFFIIPGIYILKKNSKEKNRSQKKKSKTDFAGLIVKNISEINTRYYRHVIIISSALIILLLSASGKIRPEMNPVKSFRPDAEISISDSVLNTSFTGTEVLSLILKSDSKDEMLYPSVMRKIDEVSDKTKALFPQIKSSVSAVEYIKKTNMEIYAGKKSKYVIPETFKQIKDYLLLYPNEFENFLNIRSGNNLARILFHIKNENSEKLSEIENFLNKFFNEQNKIFLKKHKIKIILTDTAHITAKNNSIIAKEFKKSLAISLFLLSLVCLSILKSFKLTAMSLVPVIGGVGTVLSIMGLNEIHLNSATFLAATAVAGIGCNYSLYFTLLFSKKRKIEADSETAAKSAASDAGKVILLNAASVIPGLLVLLYSGFLPIKSFSILTVTGIIITCACSLILIPAAINLFSILRNTHSPKIQIL